jgi:hypothetical protein
MFKPMKLSSAQNEEGETPEKGKNLENKELLIDITMNFSERELKGVPILETIMSP